MNESYHKPDNRDDIKDRDDGIFLHNLFVLESMFAGFYIAITRGLTPIFLVSIGYGLRDILFFNIIGGILSIIIVNLIYKIGPNTNIKRVLLLSHILERILWSSIVLGLYEKELATLFYIIALASIAPTSVFMSISLFMAFEDEKYRKVLSLRSAVGSATSILGQAIMTITLYTIRTYQKYAILYFLAFIIGVAGSVVTFHIPLREKRSLYKLKNTEVDAESKATNVFLALSFLLASINLLAISWVPRLMIDLNAPDYIAASIGFVQVFASIIASVFWANKRIESYRYALVLLSIIPLLVYITPMPLLHIIIAMINGFALVGANFFAGIMYSGLMKHLGIFKSATLLTATSIFASLIGNGVGYIVASISTTLVFIVASMYGVLGLTIALLAVTEVSPLPKGMVRVYSRILYNSSMNSYLFIVFTISETAKTTLKIVALSLSFIILFLIYRILHYMMVYTSG